MEVNVSDSRLAGMFRNFIARDPDPLLKGLKLCGSRLTTQSGSLSAVYVTTDGEDAKFIGTATCKSAWSCPSCTAKVMARKGADIACLIDALATWDKEYPFMVTFTLPHTRYMSCNETFQLLKQAWYRFSQATTYKKTRKPSKNTLCAQWRHKYDIKHVVRAYEFTYGENGWHPHLHVLFWTKKENFATVADAEDTLNDYWWRCLKNSRIKQMEAVRETYLNQKDLLAEEQFLLARDKYGRISLKVEMGEKAIQEQLRNIDSDALREELRQELNSSNGQKRFRAACRLNAETLFTNWRKNPVTGHKSVYFSRDKNGKARVIESSYYISGWSGDAEMTGERNKGGNKHGKGRHYTPHQLLEEAYKETDAMKRSEFLCLYKEYAIATKMSRRVEFTPSDAKLIAKWRLSNEYIRITKKKFTDKARESRVVCWFTNEQWKQICYIELRKNMAIKADILLIAKTTDWEVMRDYLLEYDIYLQPNDCNPEIADVEALINNRPFTIEQGTDVA